MSLVIEGLVQGRYRLSERLGGFGERRTWLATDECTGEQVVFKSLFFGPGSDWQNYRLFEREAQILPALDHPGIPRFRAAFWSEQPEGHYFCLVQQFVPGVSLDKWMAQGHRFDANQQVELAARLLDILAYLHAQQPPLVHRDIKPSNLILGEDGQVHLVDFGAVQAMGPEGQTLTAAGTFGYMAPEQFLGRAVPASDLYGLGTTLIHLLTGIPPAEPTRAPGVPEPDRPALQGWFGQWLKRMVQPDACRRFADGREAAQAFEALRRGGAIDDSRFVPPSDLKRFVVQEASAQRLSVDLLASEAWKSLVKAIGIGYGLVALSFMAALVIWRPEALLDFSWLTTLSCVAFLLFPQFFPVWGVRLEIGQKHCSLTRVVGSLVLRPLQTQLGPEVELKVVKPVGGAEVRERHLELWQGKCLHRFTAHLSAEELQWLLGQFQFHRDRLQRQEDLSGEA